MVVLGLTDTILPSLPRIGNLRKGAKAEGGIGHEIEWFRFAGNDDVTVAFADAYGKQPKFLAPVFLPFRTPDENFAVWKEKWGKSGLVHRCDGQMTTVVRKGNTYSTIPEKCPYAGRVYKSKAEQKADPPCDLTGRMSVILPELWRRGYVGYVTVNTGSVNDVRQILALLKAVYEGRQDLRGIAFQLRRVQQKISMPEEGTDDRVRVPHWMVQLEVAPDWARLQLEMAERQAKMIEAPGQRVSDAPQPIIDKSTGVIEEGEWGDAPDFEGDVLTEDGTTDLATGEPEQPTLPAAQGGPGWGAVPAWQEKFRALLAERRIDNSKGPGNEVVKIFGAGTKIGDIPYATVVEWVDGWVAKRETASN